MVALVYFLQDRMAAKNIVKKKANKKVKEEPLNSLRETNEAEETEINPTINLTEAIELINHYEEIIKTQNKRFMRYIYKQGEILKMFKETESFFYNAGQSRSGIYFKIGVYKLLKKTLVSKKLKLPSSYFRNNLKSMKSVCKKISQIVFVINKKQK